MHPNRRQFLGSSIAGTALTLTPRLRNELPASKSDPWYYQAPFKISLAQWSLHRTIRSGQLDNLDFAGFTKKNFAIEAVEYVNQFFKDKADDTKYLDEMKSRAADQGVRSLLIMIDGEGDLGHADEQQRKSAIDNHRKWLEAAKHLDCHSIRVNAASSGTYEEQMKRAADGLSRLSEIGETFGLNVIVENHGGLSSNGKWLADVMKQVGRENCGTLPDFGNFQFASQQWYDRYIGVRQLMPFAKAVSAKSHDFDADGNEIHTDFFRMMKIVAQQGYTGFVGIEYEGGKLGEVEGITATKKLLERVRDSLSTENE